MGKKKSFKRSYRKKPEIPIHRRKGFWPAVILPIAVIGLVYLFAFSSIFWVTEIRIFGTEALDPDEMAPIVEEGIVSSVAFLNSKSILLFSVSRMTDMLTDAFPELNSVSVKRSLPDSVEITVIERKAVASWCRDRGECFLIDREGVIFKEAPDTVRLAVIRGGDGTISLSGSPISPDVMEFMIGVRRELKDIVDLAVFEVLDPDLVIRTAEGWKVRFTLMDSAHVQTEKLVLALENKIPKERRSELDYVDVRFDNRVYFRYRDR